MESGLDNSPMYDDVPFNEEKHVMELWDAGLNGLYVADCRALADIARVLGREAEAAEVQARGDAIAQAMTLLWSEERGMYLNRRTDTGELSPRLSPTLFYPLLGRAATPAQAQRMVSEHLTNAAEFWGEWMLPMIARSDPAYADQNYWRGRIWAPTNLLTYLGLRAYGQREACAALVASSKRLLLREWLERGHIHENYNADTGDGCDIRNSDCLYHWGALLGLMALMDAGHIDGPEEPL
jgi:neutral trehalase